MLERKQKIEMGYLETQCLNGTTTQFADKTKYIVVTLDRKLNLNSHLEKNNSQKSITTDLAKNML